MRSKVANNEVNIVYKKKSRLKQEGTEELEREIVKEYIHRERERNKETMVKS